MDKNKKDLSDTEYLLRDVTIEMVNKWESILKNKCSEYTKFTEKEKNLEDYDIKYGLSKIIQNDVDRTRINERVSLPGFDKTLKRLLIYYCKLNSIKSIFNIMSTIFIKIII